MTLIKKLGLPVAAVALFAAMALTVVSTAEAAVTSLTRTPTAVSAGGAVRLTITAGATGDLALVATSGTFNVDADSDVNGDGIANDDVDSCPLDGGDCTILSGGGASIVIDDAANSLGLVVIDWVAPATVSNPGTVTITASQAGSALQTTITLRGPAATVELVALDAAPMVTNSCAGDVAAVQGIASAGAGLGIAQLCALVKDSAGNLLPDQTVIFTATGGAIGLTANQTGTGGGALGRATSTIDNATGTASGASVTVTATSGTVSGTTTIAFGGDATACSIEAPLTTGLGGIAAITVRGTDTAGNPVPDLLDITLGAIHSGSGQNVAVVPNAAVESQAGAANFQLLSAIQGVVALVGTVETPTGTVSCTGSINVQPVVPTPTPGGDGEFTGTIANSGVSLVVFGGGTVADLAAAADDENVVSISLTVGGKFVVYIVGAPAFVNAEFNSTFSGGIPAGTPVILKK